MYFIPDPDPEFDLFAKTFYDYAIANSVDLGMTSENKLELQTVYALWTPAYAAHVAAQAAANSATQKKLMTRVDLEKVIRENAGLFQANKNVTNDQKAALGITIRKETKTLSPIPETRPMAKIDNRNRLEQIVQFFDETTPNSKAKPKGVRGCDLWLKIGGAPPTGPSEVTYVATDTNSPYTYRFLETDAGKTAHWMCRWVNTRGEYGPWSETVSATISA